MFYEICDCTTLNYMVLWEYKKNIKSSKVQKDLKELANPSCKTCHGDGKYKVY